MLKHSKEFVVDEYNYFICYNHDLKNFFLDHAMIRQHSFNIYFTGENARNMIEKYRKDLHLLLI